MKMTLLRVLLVYWKLHDDNMQFWRETSVHRKSAATWCSFEHSKCILSTFGLFSCGGPQTRLSVDKNETGLPTS